MWINNVCRNLYLRKDEVTEENCQKDILRNAIITEDDYFVAPPGNIPLESKAERSEFNSQCKVKSTESSSWKVFSI